MPAIVPADVAEHVIAVRDTAPKYFKGVSDLTLRNHVVFYLLRKYGLIEYNADGHSQVWSIKVREPDVSTNTDGSRITFSQVSTDEQLSVDVRSYRTTDTMTEKQYLMNRGRTQIVNRYKRKSKDLGDAMTKRLQERFYCDGNNAAYADDYIGTATILAHDTGGTTVAGDKLALPKANYGGHKTDLAYFGGSWSANLPSGRRYNTSLANDFPFGQGRSEYDAMSPLIWNYTSTAWGTGATTWEANCERVVTEATAAMMHRSGLMNNNGAPFVNVLAGDLFISLKHKFRDRHRILTPFKDGDVGFPQESMTIDGSVYMQDYGMPAGQGQGFCPQYLEMFNMHSDIFKAYGPEWDINSAAFLYYVSAFGNYRYQPKFFCAFKAIA